jgi:hypothetical protein
MIIMIIVIIMMIIVIIMIIMIIIMIIMMIIILMMIIMIMIKMIITMIIIIIVIIMIIIMIIQVDNHVLHTHLREEATSSSESSRPRTSLPMIRTTQTEHILLESARSWVQSPLFAEGLKNFSEKDHFSFFVSELSSQGVTEGKRKNGLSAADMLMAWVERHDNTHPNFKVHIYDHDFIFILLFSITVK